MSVWTRLLSVLLVLVAEVLSSTSVGDVRGKEVRIFYLPFDYGTSVPVTPDSIEKDAFCRFVLPTEDEVVGDLRVAIEHAEDGKFSDAIVRVKIIGLMDRDVFIDQDGGVLLGRGGEQKRLCGENFTTVRTLTATLARNTPSSCSRPALAPSASGAGKLIRDHFTAR